MKCPSCGTEMIRLMAFKRQYGENIYICQNIKYHKVDMQKRAILLPCKR